MRQPDVLECLDLTALLSAATRVLADGGPGALPRLRALASQASGAACDALFPFVAEAGGLAVPEGTEAPALRAVAESCLADWRAGRPVEGPGGHSVLPLASEGDLLGLWAVGGGDREILDAFAPLLTASLREARWQAEAQAARRQVERGIREVATVYEIGQAIDRVEIDRLLEMITQKAAAVMEAQACSLMLRQPGLDTLVIAASWGLPDEVVENTRIFVGEGIAGRVAATGQPLRLNSLADDPHFRGAPPSLVPDVSSSLCVPMKDETGRVQGVLCIRRRVPTPHFTDEDVRLFAIFASQAALAINNAQLFAKLNHKLQELSTLSALTEAVSSSLDLDRVLNQVADAITDVVHLDRCRIYLADLETGRFSARITRGFHRGGDAEAEFAPGEGVIGAVAAAQAPLLVEDAGLATPARREYARALGMEAFYAQPIVARGRSIGVVVVSNDGPQRPLAGSLELLSTFVHQAGVAIGNARFHADQERRYAELTTLYEVSRTLAATSGVQKAAQTVNDLAMKITDSDAGLLLLFDGAQEGLSAQHWRGVGGALVHRLRGFLSPVRAADAARRLRAPRLLAPADAAGLLGPDWEPAVAAFLAEWRAAALVPLVADDAAVGFLLLGRRGAAFGPEELRLITVAASQAAAVLSSAASYERRIGQRELELSAAYELMQKVRAATTLDEALGSILDIVASLVWSDGAQLFTPDGDGRTLTARATRGDGGGLPAALPLDGDSIAAQAMRERAAVISSAKPGAGGGGRPQAARSQLALPLAVGDELIGVLTMQSAVPDLYTEESVKMLHLVASQAATIYREMTSLRALTRYTDNILRSIAAGVLTLDKNGTVITWNRRAEEIVRLPETVIVGRHYTDFIHRLRVDDAAHDETLHMIALTAQTGKIFTRNQLCCHLDGDGDIYLNLSASELKSEAGEYLGVVVVFEDITGEVLMKEEVERVSKLAETGQLAANIAHELRNPLSSIKGAAQLLRRDLPPDAAQHGEFLDIIIEEANGLNRITTEFLEFSRQTPPQMQPVAVNAMLARLLQFMAASLGQSGVVLTYALGDDLPPVMMDKTQIEQVVKNLVINAAQAMPRGGFVTVATRYFPAADIVEVSFTDTGVGIPPEKMAKIFAPFFTTKTKGTGLGLAIARKIVETHGGKLTTRSAPGEGSTFTIHLPTRPLYARGVPPARQEITEQRSDGAGGVYGAFGPAAPSVEYKEGKQ